MSSVVDFADFEKLALLEEIMRTSTHFKVDWANIKFPPGRTMSQSQAYINALRSSDGVDYSPLPGKQLFTPKYQTPTAAPRPPPKARTTVVATPSTGDGSVKRGRGRPRKNPLQANTPKAKTVVVEGGIMKRGRGRPSKAYLAAEAAAKAADKAKMAGASETDDTVVQLESEKEYVSEGGKSDTRDSSPMGGELVG